MEIKSSVDITGALKMTETLLRQIPFATAKALTKTGQEIKAAQVAEMRKVFDRPTSYTLNSVFLQAATKDNLVAIVWLKDSAPKGTPASKFLRPEIFGGERRLKRAERALANKGIVPEGSFLAFGKRAKLNQYGNLPASIYTSILSQAGASPDSLQNQTANSKQKRGSKRAQYFVGRPGKGDKALGVYQRMANGEIRPILVVVSKPEYHKRFDFFDVANGVFDRRFRANFDEALALAIRTARVKK